jgi:porphobilinogen synthase
MTDFSSAFPNLRLRRLRKNPALRAMFSEVTVNANDLILPLFVKEGILEPKEIISMPGVFQHTLVSLVETVKTAVASGLKSVILFGIPEHKDPTGSMADNENGIVQQAVRALKKEFSSNELVVITDTCLDEFTSHGHCGILTTEGEVDNDLTLQRYVSAAVSQATAGADMIAPSGMMDGQIQAIRAGLDEAGFNEIPIMAYSAKYASALYGPFRDAAECAPEFGDRKSYQMQPSNVREARLETFLDIIEGADIVMVKPAVAYLDVIAELRQMCDLPIAAYHVSGEYSMVKAAGANGWIDGDAVMREHLVSIKRAGADLILTYAAQDFLA